MRCRSAVTALLQLLAAVARVERSGEPINAGAPLVVAQAGVLIGTIEWYWDARIRELENCWAWRSW
jgi:hypothetical protein